MSAYQQALSRGQVDWDGWAAAVVLRSWVQPSCVVLCCPFWSVGCHAALFVNTNAAHFFKMQFLPDLQDGRF